MNRKKDQTICEWKNVQPLKPKANSNCGLALNSLNNEVFHGLRHTPENNSNGWYIWKGTYQSNEDFFNPICIEHLNQHIRINLSEFLELPPGYRFLIGSDNYVDVWYDEKLIIR